MFVRFKKSRTLKPEENLAAPPVKVTALENGLKVTQPEQMKDDGFFAELASLKPEFIIVVAYGKILPKQILQMPERGCINVHASLLPRYRGRLSFHGGLSTQKTLPFGTPDQIRREVKERIAIFGRGGGFIFNTVHNVQANTPRDNLVSLYEAFKENRGKVAG